MVQLTLCSLPPIVEENKESYANKVTILGAKVAGAEFVKALLTYGTYDRYYILWDTSDSVSVAQNRLEKYPNHERIQIIPVEHFANLRGVDKMLLFKGSPRIHDLAHFRRFQGKPYWPIIGVTHTLSYPEELIYNLTALFEELYAYDAIICTSRSGQAAIKNIFQHLSDQIKSRIGVALKFPGQFPVIPLGVDTNTYRPRDKSEARLTLNLPLDHTIFLYFGRFSTIDKMDFFPLFLGFTQSFKGHHKVSLVLAGDDTEYWLTPQLRYLAQQLEIEEQVIIMPNVGGKDKHTLYAAADVFVSLSDNVQETFGLTILEAMSSGLPVVASDWSGYRETVLHGETGFLVPTYWSPCVDQLSKLSVIRTNSATHWRLAQSVCVDQKSLMEALMRLHENPGLRFSMGNNARKRAVEHYSWATIIAQYENLWANLLEQATAFHNTHESDLKHGV